MNKSVQEYIDKYPDEVKELYIRLRTIIYDSVSYEIEEKLWAKIPSYYVGESFVRLIPFKDHVNVEAAAVLAHKEELGGYKITPKGMLQIYLKQDGLQDVLGKIFVETLDGMSVCN